VSGRRHPDCPPILFVYAHRLRVMNGFVDRSSPDVADKSEVWGPRLGTTQDPDRGRARLRNVVEATQQENLWFHGGQPAHQSRHYALFLLARQLKALYEDPHPVYGLRRYNRSELLKNSSEVSDGSLLSLVPRAAMC